GEAKIHIRPEDIILSTGTFACSARNRHKGVVQDIISDDDTAKIVLNIGIPLIALITKQSMIDMGIKKGTELYAIFKTMSVTVIK
ncbi:MAG: TOBE domain-containing protein, partial [Anaerovorax sp.]